MGGTQRLVHVELPVDDVLMLVRVLREEVRMTEGSSSTPVRVALRSRWMLERLERAVLDAEVKRGDEG